MSDQSEKIISLLIESDEDEPLDFGPKDVDPLTDMEEVIGLLTSGLLDITGSVGRNDNHYVHERTTYVELHMQLYYPDNVRDDLEREDRIGKIVNEIEEKIKSDMVGWNRKIYKELEAAYDYWSSEESVSGTLIANDYLFDEDGSIVRRGGLPYEQLDPETQEKARERWVQVSLENGDTDYSESVIAEWKWLLKNKGFSGVEIAFSGFWNQGDGASFTADSINVLTYLTAPDPLEIPEQDREQLDEGQEGEDLEPEPKEVYELDRNPKLTHISTKADYEEYKARVEEFLKQEQIRHVSAITYDNDGKIVQDEFSKRPCECCKRPLAGSRINVSAYHEPTKEILTYWICPDCFYYLEYGQLDDMTMMDLDKNSVNENEEPDADTKEIIGEPRKAIFQVRSSHGSLYADALDGWVISTRLSPEPDGQVLKEITRFDLNEWHKTYPGKIIQRHSSIDILDLGYWLKDGKYEPPDQEWRELMAPDHYARQVDNPGN